MGNVLINKTTIEDFLQGQNFENLLGAIDQEREEPERLKSSREYFKVIGKNNENVIIENTQNYFLGNCRLKLLVGEGLPKKVCFLRNGMLITDNLHGLMRFYNFKDFVAVFECMNEGGNALLREMEPPRHDDFEPELLSKEHQQNGKRALNSIKGWIKSMLKRHAQDPVEDETSLDELAQFIGTESSESDDNQKQEMNPVGQVRITAKPPKRKKISAPFINEQGDGDGNEGDGSNGGDTLINISPNDNPGEQIQQGSGGNNGGEGSESHPPVRLINVRLLEAENNKSNLFFTPTKSGTIRVKFLLSGADSDYATNILYSEKGEVKNGDLYIEVVANERVRSLIEVEGATEVSLKVVANEV